MKKVIGIYCGNIAYEPWDENLILKNGGGGSETWAAELAREFQRIGFHVIVFGIPPCWEFAESGVEYVPYELFESRIAYQHFDYFISSRQISEVTNGLHCPNVYIIAHDFCLHYAESFSDMKMDRVAKIAYLSEWQRHALSDYYKHEFTDKDSFRTFNGVDDLTYTIARTTQKKNKMVWSTVGERGLMFFVNRVFPVIKSEVPDFELDVCLYTDADKYEGLKNIDGINLIGKIGKEELSKRQGESKIWVYPNLGYLDTTGVPCYETFCITAIENGMAGNAIFTSRLGGIGSTLSDYGLFCGDGLFEDYGNACGRFPEENLGQYADELSVLSIRALTDDNFRAELSKRAVEATKKYTWKESAKTWLKEWNLLYE